MMNNSSMPREVQQSVSVSDTKYDEQDSDLLINNLIYEMPKALSLATGRTHVKQYPQRNTYNVDRNTTMVFDWNTGNSYIDAKNSYLTFKMRAINPNVQIPLAPVFGTGSALNLFREVRIRSRSGVELSRLENCNVYNKNRLDYTMTPAWKSSIGRSFFYDVNIYPFTADNIKIPTVTIPLCEIDSFFRPLKGQLIPAQLASGLRIELSMESLQKAFVDPLGWLTPATVELFDISMVLDTVNLSDETSKLLNLESSQSGLEYCYPRVYNFSNVYQAGTSNFSLQITKSVSQAVHVHACIQNSDAVNSPTADSLASESWKITSYQWRLGSQYYPHQALIMSTGNGESDSYEAYMLTMSSYNKISTPFKESRVEADDYYNNKGVISTSLERNQSLQISGSPINNSRILELLVERDGSSDGNSKVEVNSFLEYVSVCKAYIDNVAVAI